MTALLIEGSRKTLLIMARGNRRIEVIRPQRNIGRVRSVKIVDFPIFLKIKNRTEALLKNPNIMMGRRQMR